MIDRIKIFLLMILFVISFFSSADAGGWSTVHRYVRPSGKCGMAREVMASFYWTGRKTANGERFNPEGNTAASRGARLGGWDMGTTLYLRNPANGLSLTIRVNDSGPYGIAHRLGTKLDLARGAARRLKMHQTAYLCVSG